MSCDQVPIAEADFHRQFDETCDKGLDASATAMLAEVFHYTIRYALCEKGKKWNKKAKIYVLPKVAEIATRVSLESGDMANKDIILAHAHHVITKYHRTGNRLAWCDGWMKRFAPR